MASLMRPFNSEDYLLLVESIVDYAIFMLDAEGRVATWNVGAQKIKGYRADEIIGHHFSAFYSAEERLAGKPSLMLQAAAQLGRIEDEGWRVRKDGSRFWANVVITALRDGEGKLRGFGKVTRDLTGRREAEENERRLIEERAARAAAELAEQKLRESEERYKALSTRLEIVLEGVADGITVQDRSGKIVFANSTAARFFGLSTVEELLDARREAVVERFDLLDETGRPFKIADLPAHRVLSGEPTASALIHVRERGTGKNCWLRVRASSVLASDGTPELAVSIWHDVTSEHRVERDARYVAEATNALSSSVQPDELLSAFAWGLIPSLADWCAIYLLEGSSLRNVASAHADPTKLPIAREYQARFPPEVSKSAVWSVVRSGVPELYNDISDAFLAQLASDPQQLALLRSLGVKGLAVAPILHRSRVLGAIAISSAESQRRYDSSHLDLLVELGGRAAVALEHAALYRNARAAASAAEAASRAKDEFLATVSHELRTPLSAILGWSTLLLDRVRDPALLKPLESIHRNARAQVRIIEDILDVSRVITGKFYIDPKSIDVLDVAHQAADVVRASAVAKSVRLELDFEHHSCLLVADPERIQQVIWNLLSNAVKFTPSGGKVTLSVRQIDSYVVLRVTDTGVGIDPAFLPYVFDRFRQGDPSTTRRVGGLGLGLALVRHIVELHGGTVDAESAGRGSGATFSIHLPIRAVVPPPSDHPPPPESSRTPAATADLTDVRALVVDDEADARDVISAVLEDAGAMVATASSAAEGLAAFERFDAQVILSDIAMPDEDGFAFVRRLRELPAGKGVPILALTAFARPEDAARAIEAGFDGHLRKPVEPDALLGAVANVLNRERQAS
jgi:PAS domain S-box-containing protein